ncbi:uncharacterized protein L203_104705 [Cryptococcus depauperatus CBS 7841]|uniref:HTH La-type RNA-binding domain-containing protein n=1 Tax=Cryptococcus depauperatus CBS 7841 TaxID=1295531 RepID=A0AAJ8JW01_9TREE
MLALQSSPPVLIFSHQLNPHTHTVVSVPKMSNQSVFSALGGLGSYADRIKDVNGSYVPLFDQSSSHIPARSPDQITPQESVTKKTSSGAEKNEGVAPAAIEDDGPWETVQPRLRNKSERADHSDHISNERVEIKEKDQEKSQTQAQKRGSSSRNWRDRSNRDESSGPKSEKDKDAGGEKKRGRRSEKKGSPSTTTGTSVSADASSGTAISISEKKPTISTKNAWGLGTSTAGATVATSTSTSSVPTTRNMSAASTVPSSPANTNHPLPSNSSISSQRAQGGQTKESADESHWRAKPASLSKVDGDETIDKTGQKELQISNQQSKKPAPPPTINIWDLRKKMSAPSLSTNTQPQSQLDQDHAMGKSQLNGIDTATDSVSTSTAAFTQSKSAASSGKKNSAATNTQSILPSIHDATLWPNVSQTVKGDEKKGKKGEKNEKEITDVEEHPSGPTKKPKWKPIPAHELLAAADQAAAEQARRQNRSDAKKRLHTNTSSGGGTKGEGEGGLGGKAKGRKPHSNAGDGRKGHVRNTSIASQSAEYENEKVNGNNNGKGKNGDVDSKLGTTSQALAVEAGSTSESSPITTASNTNSISTMTRAPSSQPLTGSSTAPLPSHHFIPASNPNLPRPPRGRIDRGSFAGRGRGGFRPSSVIAHKAVSVQGGYGSPPIGALPSPVEGMGYPGAHAPSNLYQRGYGMGFQSLYPTAAGGHANQGAGGVYDPMQAQYANMGFYRGTVIPPPPMPQTVVPNLDPLRFYVLGQVEYYFSMQNLAMDFFLRQQMDDQGWIDISMISSFNRVKSLTPEIAIVRECMMLSNYLEVREDKVRLAGSESRRWVLPDAKTSKFGPDPRSPANRVNEKELPTSAGLEGTEGGKEQQISTAPIMQQRQFVAAEVENALMKSSSGVGASADLMASGTGVGAINSRKENGSETLEGSVSAKRITGDMIE